MAKVNFIPKNEQGVVFYFGAVAASAGIDVIHVQTEFPDFEFMHKDTLYRGEFERKSSNFWAHDHDYLGCDLVVCWMHDARLGPMPVIELSDSAWRRKFRKMSFPMREEKDAFLAMRFAEKVITLSAETKVQVVAPTEEALGEVNAERAKRVLKANLGDALYKRVGLLRLQYPADPYLVTYEDGTESVLCFTCYRTLRAAGEPIGDLLDDAYVKKGVCVNCILLGERNEVDRLVALQGLELLNAQAFVAAQQGAKVGEVVSPLPSSYAQARPGEEY